MVSVPLARAQTAQPAKPAELNGKLLSGAQVLCIDNEDSILIGMNSLLTRWGCQVWTARNRDECVALLDEGVRPQLALVDYHLDHGETGTELMAWLRTRLGEPVPGVVISADGRPEMVAKVQPLVKWAGYLPPEQGTPKADELPTFYAAVVQDTAIPGDLATDTGIALANMTLAAWDKGVGSCIMGAINKPALTELLGIEEPQKLAFMVAFGYPAHKAHIVPLTAETGVKYYLDENRDYCVPKRSKEEIAKYL